MKRQGKRYISLLALILAACVAASCVTSSTRTYSSVVQYLYPEKSEPVETPSIPELRLPIKVGVAFVPDLASDRSGRNARFGRPASSPISEQERMTLMKAISDSFTQYPFVAKPIELIPSQYLTPGGSFVNLDQVRSMHGIDVIALLSYDQIQFTDEGFWTITYWTLVGAYVIKGERNSTSTLMDAAVYHIPSRKMLFRAPGTSTIKSRATPVNLTEQLREDAHEGFKDAAKDLVKNLQAQLQVFQERVKTSPEQYRVVHTPGYRGGGSLDGFTALLAVAMGGYLLWSNRKKRK